MFQEFLAFLRTTYRTAKLKDVNKCISSASLAAAREHGLAGRGGEGGGGIVIEMKMDRFQRSIYSSNLKALLNKQLNQVVFEQM